MFIKRGDTIKRVRARRRAFYITYFTHSALLINTLIYCEVRKCLAVRLRLAVETLQSSHDNIITRNVQATQGKVGCDSVRPRFSLTILI